ncbi:MAG TPA: bifunctional homocysteine S-methyltransferase/methylenetetrahydrofolate reductase [Candidatus Krumholzibacteria bacterium]|jgi:homocysteine S-methyltransferase
MNHPFEFLAALGQRPLLFDGAIGTELYRRGVFLTSNFEELCLTRPSLVKEVHRDYLKAGAEIITTNSYGAGRKRLEKFGLEEKVGEINRAAAEIAREAAGRGAWVAGSVGPTGLPATSYMGSSATSFKDDLREQIEALRAGGADLLLFETFTQLAEVHLAVDVARRVASKLPIIVTMRFEPNEKLPDGSEPEAVARALKEMGVDVIGANCGEGPGLVFRAAQRMLGLGVPVIAQPNAGSPEELEGRTIYVSNPEYFGVYGRRMLKAGIQGVGGCCGTTPDHIRRMRGAIRMMGHAELKIEERKEHTASIRVDRVPPAERSRLAEKMTRGEFVVSVEVNPPPGLNADASIQAAKMLRDSGIDVVNIADGPRARVRMSNWAQGVQIQRDLDMEVLLHVCCRDRNLLGLQSDLLGVHALGIRNLVVITGDPPKMGDYPDASAVYDLDSIGLLEIVDGLNHGVDPSGKAMDEPTRFWVATGAEPGALDYDREIRRLERKIAAGADFIMTQPVYDPETIDRFLADTAGFGRPILLGLLPLASYRNAEFLNAEVPGMNVPVAIRERMKAAGKGESARAEGVKIAQEALLAARDRIAGAYIMPPLGHYGMAPEILKILG